MILKGGSKIQTLCPIELPLDCFFAVVAALFWIAYLIPMLLGNHWEDPIMGMCAAGSLQYVAGMGALLWFVRLRQWPSVNASKMHPIDALFAGIVGEIMLFPVLSIFSILWRHVLDTDFVEQPLLILLRSGLTHERQFWAILFLVVILAPIAEEIFFRYFLYRFLRLKLSPCGATLGTAFIFALLHFNWGAFVPLLVMGSFLVLCYERCGNLLPCIILHGVHNYVAVMVVLLFPEKRWL
jgi:membrane protease YdiL (CAAX protease family)